MQRSVTLWIMLLFCGTIVACTGSQALPWSAEKPVIQFDYGSFLVTYMDASSAYALARYVVTQECLTGARAKAQCDILAAADAKIQGADAEVRRSIQDPRYPIDWARMQAFLGDVVGALVKIGVKGAAGL